MTEIQFVQQGALLTLTLFPSNKPYSIQKKTSDSNNNNKQKNKRRENADKIWT